jgi:hypothetical protein
MLRVTLLEDAGRLRMQYGYDVTVPMHFGSITDPAMMVDFRSPPRALPAEPRTWILDFANEETRSVLMDEPVVVHYFGDMRAGPGDDERVRARTIPSFEQERMRVAQVWGDYLYSDQHGLYSTVRIAVPSVPKVIVQPVSASGATVANAWAYAPLEFFRFEELLSADADAEMLVRASRRRPMVPAGHAPAEIDLSNLSEAQLDVLARRMLEMQRATKTKVS